MTEGRCGTCKHWTQDQWGSPNAGHCAESMKPPSSFAPMAASAKGFTHADAYKHPPYLRTLPDFGCILHEPR